MQANKYEINRNATEKLSSFLNKSFKSRSILDSHSKVRPYITIIDTVSDTKCICKVKAITKLERECVTIDKDEFKRFIDEFSPLSFTLGYAYVYLTPNNTFSAYIETIDDAKSTLLFNETYSFDIDNIDTTATCDTVINTIIQ